MHFSLYFPGQTGASNAPLDRCGLAALYADRSPQWAPLERGPDGGPGLLAVWQCGDPERDPPLAVTPTQDWQPCRPVLAAGAGARATEGEHQPPAPALPAGAYWVGIDRERPPTPADLAHKTTYAGYWIRLADGQEWHVPTAALMSPLADLDEHGRYCERPRGEFAGFWHKSEKYAQAMFTAALQHNALSLVAKKEPPPIAVEFDREELFQFCVEALAFNYRLNAEIVARLGLFDQLTMSTIVKAVIDLPKILDTQREKKTEPLSIPIPAG